MVVDWVRARLPGDHEHEVVNGNFLLVDELGLTFHWMLLCLLTLSWRVREFKKLVCIRRFVSKDEVHVLLEVTQCKLHTATSVSQSRSQASQDSSYSTTWKSRKSEYSSYSTTWKSWKSPMR